MVTKSLLKKYFRFLVFCVLYLFTIFSIQAKVNLDKQRNDFVKTEKLILQGKIRSENQIPDHLKSYSLYPYLELELLKSQLKFSPIEKVTDFYKKYDDSPVSKTLNYHWISFLAKGGRWSEILTYYLANTSTNLKCLYSTAVEHTSPELITPADINDLWLSGQTRPKECDQLFNIWLDKKIITHELIWKRIYLAMEENNTALVRKLGLRLSEPEFDDIKLWLRVHQNNNLINNFQLFDPNNLFHQKITIYALKKIGTRNLDLALRNYRDLNQRYNFSDENKYDFYKFAAIKMFAMDHEKTELMINDIPLEYYDEPLHTAAIKSALRNNDWPAVIKRIEEMPDELKSQDIWVYWLARAYGEVKDDYTSKDLFAKISNKTNYYGLLACNQLKQMCPIEFAIVEPYRADKIRLLQNPGINRAIELYRLKRFTQARLEWNTILKKLSPKEQFIAATIASDLNWHDRNIVNFAKEANSENTNPNAFLHLRYPLVNQSSVLKFAKKYNIDPAWVFAISRQESAFISNAKSRAGALGLMQLMPDTARKLAKQNKIPYRNPSSLLNESTNISLGSAYLQQMLGTHKGNPVLATAAYNAGPGRVRKWMRESKPVATDVWIELVPFYETRDYLKRVLTNTAIYRSRLGKSPTILSELMPITMDVNK